MPSLLQSLAPGWSFQILPIATSPKEEKELDHHIATIVVPTGRFMMGWAIIMIFLWWPTDLLVFRRLPPAISAFASLRAVLLLTSVLVLLFLWNRKDVLPQIQPFFVTPWLLACVALGYFLGTLGGLETPWFHFSYLGVSLSIFFPVRTKARMVYSFLIGLALLSGNYLASPSMFSSPFLPATIGFMVFIMIGSVAFGQLLYLLTRSNYFQSQALKRNADELATQVAERTKELRQLATHMDHALETERARISRELHDELGQELTALRYELRLAIQRFSNEPASIRANLANLEEILARTTSTTRNIVTDLRPRILDDMGLCAAVEWLMERTRDRTMLDCTLTIEGNEPHGLRSETSIAAFRIVQESSTNVIRHASASKLEVILQFADGNLTIFVLDDGVGTKRQADSKQGMGILGMRERARALGGSLQLTPRECGGTQVHCTLPMRQNS